MSRVSGAIPKRLLTTVGDIITASAVGVPARIAAPALGQFLRGQGVGVLPAYVAPGAKRITSSRDVTAASGNVSYTGVGFVPSAIIALGVINLTEYVSVGFCDGNLASEMIYGKEGGVSLAWSYNVNRLFTYIDATGSQAAIVASLDSDGLTLTWTKGAAPGAGTLILQFLCLR